MDLEVTYIEIVADDTPHLLPNKDQIPHPLPKGVLGNQQHEKYGEWQSLIDYDSRVAHTQFVDGFGDKPCPKHERWIPFCLAGALTHMKSQQLIKPSEYHNRACEYWVVNGLWKLVWETGKEIAMPQPIWESICRLAVVQRIVGDREEGCTYTSAIAQQWEERQYMPVLHGFGSLASWAKDNPKYELFPDEEHEFLRQLAKSWQLMADELAENVRPLYKW